MMMKVQLFFGIVIMALLSSCAEQPEVKIQVQSQPYGIAKFTSDYVQNLAELPETDVPLFLTNGGDTLVSQFFPDQETFSEVWVKVDDQTEIVMKSCSLNQYPDFSRHTNIRAARKTPELREVATLERGPEASKPRPSADVQLEGPGWENEHVAFRNYFDERNGIDIFGKKVDSMVLDEAGKPGGTSYHEMAGWGMDVLKVGNSLGAGAIALRIGDSLYRIGPDAKGDFKILVEGPLFSAIEFGFYDWMVANNTYDVRHIIAIQSGTHFYQSFVTIDGLQGGEQLVTGIVNKHSDSLYQWAGDSQMIMGTYDNQGYLEEKLGMAIKVDKDDWIEYLITPDSGPGITETYAVALNILPDEMVSYQFYSCWEYENQKFSQKEGFTEFIESELGRDMPLLPQTISQ